YRQYRDGGADGRSGGAVANGYRLRAVDLHQPLRTGWAGDRSSKRRPYTMPTVATILQYAAGVSARMVQMGVWQHTDGSVGSDVTPVPGIGRCDRSKFGGTPLELASWWKDPHILAVLVHQIEAH